MKILVLCFLPVAFRCRSTSLRTSRALDRDGGRAPLSRSGGRSRTVEPLKRPRQELADRNMQRRAGLTDDLARPSPAAEWEIA